MVNLRESLAVLRPAHKMKMEQGEALGQSNISIAANRLFAQHCAVKLKVYEYKNCGTCRKALKFLADHKVEFEAIPIRERPPTKTELRRMLGFYQGDIRRLFNTSGLDYRALNLKTKLPTMTTDEAIGLLSANGKLVKRPFVLTSKGGLVGFNQAQWQGLLLPKR